MYPFQSCEWNRALSTSDHYCSLLRVLYGNETRNSTGCLDETFEAVSTEVEVTYRFVGIWKEQYIPDFSFPVGEFFEESKTENVIRTWEYK